MQQGNSALHKAVVSKRKDVVEALLSVGADPSLPGHVR